MENTGIVLYERARGNVKVTALQLAKDEAGKHGYVINGYVDGECVQALNIEGGYRPQAGAARTLFKELCDANLPKDHSETKEPRVTKKYTIAERDTEIARLTARIEKLNAIETISEEESAQIAAEAKAAKDAAKAAAEAPVVADEDEDVDLDIPALEE